MNKMMDDLKPIFLVGFMGSGKSTFGRQLAKDLGYAFIDLDTYIEEIAGESVAEVFEHLGEEHFRQLEKQAIDDLSAQVHAVIATGGGAPCFYDNMDRMNAAGKTVYLKLAPELLAQRLKGDTVNVRPLVLGKKDDELVSFISDKLNVREVFYGKAHFTVNADKPFELLPFLS